MGLATDTTVYLSGGEKRVKSTKLTFTIRASDSSWRLRRPGHPLLPGTCWVLVSTHPLPRIPPPLCARWL